MANSNITIKHSAALVVTIASTMIVAFSLRPCWSLQLGSRTCGGPRSTRYKYHLLPALTPSSSPSTTTTVQHPAWLRFHQCQSLSRLHSSAPSKASTDSKTRILFLGTPDVAASSLRSIHEQSQKPDSPFEIVGVVTQPPKRRKRRGKEIPSPVGLVAEELGLPVTCPESARDKDFLDTFEHEVKPDLCITAAYGQYLPKRFLAGSKLGTLNIHPSLLPRWRGASPVQRSLEAGDNAVGVSVLFTVSKMDAGPIIAQESLEIDENVQATTLLPTLFDIGTKCLLEALPEVIEGKVTMDTATAQDSGLVTEAGMIDSAEGQLWPHNMTAIECHNRVRGFSMWPGTFLYFQIGPDQPESKPVKVKVIESRVLAEMTDPTDIIEIGPNKKDGLRLVCSDGSVLEMLKVQPATKKVMDAKSFVNGLQGRTVRWLR